MCDFRAVVPLHDGECPGRRWEYGQWKDYRAAASVDVRQRKLKQLVKLLERQKLCVNVNYEADSEGRPIAVVTAV